MKTLLLLSLLGWPIHGPVTQEPSSSHPAVDIACTVGDDVRSTHSGRLRSGRTTTLGNVATVEGLRWSSFYAHLDTVTADREVKSGEVIGTCGNTGTLTTGPHLHYSVKDLQNLK
jgi:murein DD-endopeptidase MepM/ murein hydrolase activator NlpD